VDNYPDRGGTIAVSASAFSEAIVYTISIGVSAVNTISRITTVVKAIIYTVSIRIGAVNNITIGVSAINTVTISVGTVRVIRINVFLIFKYRL
jgi:hypothetical protein